MPPFQFRPNVRYRNDQNLNVSSYGPIRVPGGVSARAPFFVSAVEMQRLAPANTIKVIAGLTTADFSLRFASPTQQWGQVRLGGPASRWQFQGGVVILDIVISVYVADGFKPFPKTVAVILEHEFLHVQDEIDIISRFMPRAALQDEYVQKYLTRGQDADESMYRRWFAGNGFQDWLRDGVWVPEHNKRAEARDSGAAWESYRKRIDELQRSPN